MIVPPVPVSSSDLDLLRVALSDQPKLDNRIAFIQKIWTEKFAGHYGQIKLGYRPYINDSYARAEYGGKHNWTITFRQKLVTDPAIDEAVLRFIFAHEIGHVIGQRSMNDRCNVGIAAEGEADYFLATAMQCAGYTSVDIDSAVTEGLKWLQTVVAKSNVKSETTIILPCQHATIDCRVSTIQMGVKFAQDPSVRNKPNCAGLPV